MKRFGYLTQAALCVALVIIACLSSAQSYTYQVVGPTSPFGYFQPRNLNDSRLVVGHVSGSTRSYAAYWLNGSTALLQDLPGATASAAYFLNNEGSILGYCRVGGVNRAAYWPTSTSAPIDITPAWESNSDPVYLASNGKALFYSGNSVYYVYDPITGQRSAMPNSFVRFSAFNAKNTFVGIENSFLGTLTALGSGTSQFGTLGGRNSQMFLINDQGAFAGQSQDSNGDMFPVLWRPFTPNGMTGKLQSIGRLRSGSQSVVTGMNAWNWLVGYDVLQSASTNGWLWREGSPMVNLNAVKPATVTGTITHGMSINTSGDILITWKPTPSTEEYGILRAN